MTEKCFVDTNILFYAIDRDGSQRHHASRQLLQNLRVSGFFVSTQVILELANTCQRKLKLRGDDLLAVLKLDPFATVVATTEQDVLSAVRLIDQASISIWDAMIVTAAGKAGCSTIYSEDLGHNQLYGGVRIINPLAGLSAA